MGAGALSSVAAGNADVGDLNTVFASRLQAWLNDLSDSDKALISITSAYRDVAQQSGLFAASDQTGRMVAAPGGSAHNYGIAADVSGMSDAARQALAAYGLHTPMSWEPWHVEPIETLSADQASAAARRQSFQSFVSGSTQYASGLFPTSGQQPAAAQGPVSNTVSQEEISNLDDAGKKFDRLNDAAKEFGQHGIFDRAYWNAFYSDGLSGQARLDDAWQKGNQALASNQTELDKTAQAQSLVNQGAVGVAKAYGESETAGLQAAAAEQARADAMEKGGDITARSQQILATWAATAIKSSAEALPGLAQQLTATQNLADAAAKGTAAEHDAQVQNTITAATHDALAKAIASGNPALIAEARNVTAATAALVKKNDAAQTALQLNQQINANDNSIQVAQLEMSLQGQTADQIRQQVALLQAKQFLQSKSIDLASDEAQKYLASVGAVGQVNAALTQTQREQSRVDDTMRSIGQIDRLVDHPELRKCVLRPDDHQMG